MDLRAFDAFLMSAERGPRERIETFGRQQLASLLRHAAATVPFYRFRLSPVFRKDGTVDLARFQDLPVLTRKEVAQHHDMMVSRRPIAAHGVLDEITTSGSTGTPVRFRPTAWMLATSGAAMWRAWRARGIHWQKTFLMRDYITKGDEGSVEHRGPWGPAWDPLGARGRMLAMSGDASIEQFYEAMQRHKPAYVSAGSNAIHELIRLNRQSPAPIRIDGFFSRGAPILDDDLHLARESFGAEIIDLYSAKEAGSIAHRCPEHDQWHLNEELVLVEVLDKDGRPVAPGEEGRVVLTPFGSTLMPLIRYEIGDLALGGAPCACGRTTRTLGRLTGRSAHTFRNPETGDTISPIIRLHPVKQQAGIGQWQVAQTGPRRIEVRLPGTDPLPSPVEEVIRKGLCAALFPAEIVFVAGADLRPGHNDKVAEYLNEWHPPDGDRRAYSGRSPEPVSAARSKRATAVR